MSDPEATDLSPSLGGASRRVVLQAIGFAGALTAISAARPHPARAQDATPSSATGLPALTGATYIGPTSDPNAFLAIVVAEQEARAHLCNAADIVEWFDEGGVTGEGSTSQLDLRSAAGAHLVGTVSAASASGEITLPNGKTLSFDAPLATGLDGLYTFTVGADGRAAGVSSTGARLTGQLTLSGTITPPDGAPAPFAWPAQLDDVAELRAIYQEARGRRGEGKTRKGSRLVIQP